MKIFGINLGKSETPKQDELGAGKEKKSSLVGDLKGFSKKIVGHQLFFVILLIALVVALTALQMLRYSDPPADENRAQENITKVKRIVIDENVVSQINELRDPGVSASPDINSSRTNPFNE